MAFITGSRKQISFLPLKYRELCGEGKPLVRKGTSFGDKNKHCYKAEGKVCRGCKHFGVCTKSKDGRRVIRMGNAELLVESL